MMSYDTYVQEMCNQIKLMWILQNSWQNSRRKLIWMNERKSDRESHKKKTETTTTKQQLPST